MCFFAAVRTLFNKTLNDSCTSIMTRNYDLYQLHPEVLQVSASRTHDLRLDDVHPPHGILAQA